MVRMRRNMTKHALGGVFTGVAEPGVELAQLLVVDAIDEGEETLGAPVSVSDVARLVGVDVPRASRLLAGAVEAGYARRVPSATDRRRINIELAPAGRELAQRVRRFRTEFYQGLMQDWSPEEQALFARLLSRFASSLNDATARSRQTR